MSNYTLTRGKAQDKLVHGQFYLEDMNGGLLVACIKAGNVTHTLAFNVYTYNSRLKMSAYERSISGLISRVTEHQWLVSGVPDCLFTSTLYLNG